MVVHDDHLHGCLLLHNGAELFDTHLETAVAHKTTDGALRGCEGGADGGGHTVAHRAETTAGADAALVVILEVTRRKELILTNICHEDSIVRSLNGHRVNDLTHT